MPPERHPPIATDCVDNLALRLAQLPDKPVDVTVKTFCVQNRAVLRRALKAGKTIDDIVILANQHGVHLTADELTIFLEQRRTKSLPNTALMPNQATNLLKALEEWAAKTLSLREVVKVLQPTITDLRRRGYTYAEIAMQMREDGITIAGSTLKKYYNGCDSSVGARTDKSPHMARKKLPSSFGNNLRKQFDF